MSADSDVVVIPYFSERKSGTERTKNRKKRELVFFPLLGGATGTVVHRLDSRRYKDFTRAAITRDIFIRALQAKHARFYKRTWADQNGDPVLRNTQFQNH